MKKQPLLWAILIAAGLVSCSRHHTSGNGCIGRYLRSSATLVRTGQLDTIDRYFQQNNLSTAGLQFFSGTGFSITSTTYTGAVYQTSANAWINGLFVASGSVSYEFDSTGVLLFSAGVFTGQMPNSDTSSHQSLSALQQLFLNNYKQCTFEGGALNSKPTHPTAPYQDSCLTAELVYVDAGIQNNGTPYGQQLVKAWLVTAADNPGYPEVTVIDNTGQAIPITVAVP